MRVGFSDVGARPRGSTQKSGLPVTARIGRGVFPGPAAPRPAPACRSCGRISRMPSGRIPRPVRGSEKDQENW